MQLIQPLSRPNLLHLLQPSEMADPTRRRPRTSSLTAVSRPCAGPAEILARVQEDTRQNPYAAGLKTPASSRRRQKTGSLRGGGGNHRSMTSTGNFRLNQRFIPTSLPGQTHRRTDRKTRALLEEATPTIRIRCFGELAASEASSSNWPTST